MIERKEDPVKILLEQIGEILNVFHKGYKKEGKPEIPEDISNQLEEIEMGVHFLRQTYQLALEKTGVSETEITKQIQQHPDYLSEQEKKMLTEIMMMQSETMAIRNAAEHFLEEAKRKEEKDKKVGEARRKKMKRDMGQRKGWKKI